MEQLLSEGSRRQRRLLIHPRWKQWGSRSRVPSPGGGVREEGHASTQSSYASALKPEELRESFLGDGWRGGGSWLRARRSGWLPGIRLRWRGLVCESGTAALVFNLQTRTKRHPCAHTFACSEEAQTRGLTHISRTNCYRRSLVFVHKMLRVKHRELHC